MRIFVLAFKDVLQVVRDRRSLLFMLLMPLVFTGFMGFAFAPSVQNTDNRLVVGWVNRDGQGFFSQALRQELERSSAIRLTEIAPDQAADAAKKVEKGSLTALLDIPAGFSEQLIAGQAAPISLLTQPASNTGDTARQAALAGLARVLSSAEMGRIAAEQAKTPADKRVEVVTKTAQQALTAWQQPALTLSVEKVGEKPAETKIPNPFNQTSPGMMVQFTIFGLMNPAMLLVLERKTRTLQRLMSTSMRRWEILAGHYFAMTLIILLQELLLAAFGHLVLNVRYFDQPVATLMILVGFALWVAALGMLIGIFAREEDQVVLFALISMFIFTSLGGAWFPLEGTGAAFNTVGHLLPTAWVMDGLQNVVMRGLGAASNVLATGILLAYALVFMAAAVWKFKTE